MRAPIRLTSPLDLAMELCEGAQVQGQLCSQSPDKTKFNFRLVRSEAMSTGKVRAPRPTLKAARVQLEMKQKDLALAAGLSEHAIVDFESGKGSPHASTWEAIQTALESRGIVFTNGDRPGFYFDKEKAAIPT